MEFCQSNMCTTALRIAIWGSWIFHNCIVRSLTKKPVTGARWSSRTISWSLIRCTIIHMPLQCPRHTIIQNLNTKTPYKRPSRGAMGCIFRVHDDVIKWEHFPSYWPFVRGIHRSPVNSPHKGQWREAFMFSLMCAWTNGWVNNRCAGDLRRHLDHYDVTVMTLGNETTLNLTIMPFVLPIKCGDFY